MLSFVLLVNQVSIYIDYLLTYLGNNRNMVEVVIVNAVEIGSMAVKFYIFANGIIGRQYRAAPAERRGGRSRVEDEGRVALEDPDRKKFDRAMDRNTLNGIPFDVRFHLHPDVHAQIDLGGVAVSMVPSPQVTCRKCP